AVVAFGVGQAKEALLENRVVAVPQCEREAELLGVVGDAGQAVLAPVVRARARLIVREVFPRVAVDAVILADRSPLALAQIRTPLPPGHAAVARRLQARQLPALLALIPNTVLAHDSLRSIDLPHTQRWR